MEIFLTISNEGQIRVQITNKVLKYDFYRGIKNRVSFSHLDKHTESFQVVRTRSTDIFIKNTN